MTSSLYVRQQLPFELVAVNILVAGREDLNKVSAEMGLALTPQEMQRIRSYFIAKGRSPTDVELQTLGQTWSEHCCHKTFKGYVLSPTGETLARNMFRSFISRSMQELNPSWCFSAFEDNAGIVEFEKGYGIAVKVETHNHPSAVEPFGGAATGTGGVIRDVLGVWAKPIACTDVLCFGPLDYSADLPEGIKHPNYLYRGVVAGIGHYGNNMGIPTVNGAVYFDQGYVGNPLVYCGCVGILPTAKYVRATRTGDALVLVGGRTGRDGIHGVTFASLELSGELGKFRPAVQIPNPVEEEKIGRAVIRVRDLAFATGITDLGGGGLSSAVCETAERHGCGVHVELDRVPLRSAEMNPWEIWVSESQERMLLSVKRENVSKVLEVFEEEEVEATVIGEYTGDGVLRINYRNRQVAELDIAFLFDPPESSKVADWHPPVNAEPRLPEPEELGEVLKAILSSPNVASKEAVVRTYDHEVQGNTALKPLQGRFSGPNDASVIKPLDGSWQGVSISCGMNPRYGGIDPYWMAASAIDEAIRNNTAVGGRRIALLDNFSWGNPDKPGRMGGLLRAVKACYDFSLAYGTPFISGKDSLYNESVLGPVTPTLLITAVGLVPDVRRVVSMELKDMGNLIYLVGETLLELGGSEYYRTCGFIGSSVPKVDAKRAAGLMAALVRAMDLGCIRACHDLSEGGLGVAAAEMSFSGGVGAELDLSLVPRRGVERADMILFSESNSRFLVEVSESGKTLFESALRGAPFGLIGKTNRSDSLLIHGWDGRLVLEERLKDLRECWRSPHA